MQSPARPARPNQSGRYELMPIHFSGSDGGKKETKLNLAVLENNKRDKGVFVRFEVHK